MEQLELFPDDLLVEFNNAFEPPDTPEFWLGLVKEEYAEVKKAIADLLKELVDLDYVNTGAVLAGATDEQIDEAAPMLDLEYGLHVAFSPVFETAFRRVHANNMSKRHPDGTVKRREDGKILKPEGYQPVDLSDLVR